MTNAAELAKMLDELANLGSLMTRGQLTQPRSVGPRIVGIAEEIRALAAQQDGAWQPIETAPADAQVWKPEENEALRAGILGGMTQEQIAARVGRSKAGVNSRIQTLGLSRVRDGSQ